MSGYASESAPKDPGGRPKKKSGGTKIVTQDETAISFGAPCTESKIANWEAYGYGATGSARSTTTVSS